MRAVVVGLVIVALCSWLGAVALASRAARLGLPWSLTNGGPPHSDQRAEQAAVARVWCVGLGSLSTVAVLGALGCAVFA